MVPPSIHPSIHPKCRLSYTQPRYLRLRSPSALRTSAWLWWPWSGPPWSGADQSLGQGAGGSQTYSASPGRETVDTEFKSHPKHFKDLKYPKAAKRIWHLFLFTVCVCLSMYSQVIRELQQSSIYLPAHVNYSTRGMISQSGRVCTPV